MIDEVEVRLLNEERTADLVTVQLGVAVREFSKTRVGGLLLSKLDSRRERALDVFRTADVTDVSLMQTLQNDIFLREFFLATLSEAMNNGESARKKVEEEEGEPLPDF